MTFLGRKPEEKTLVDEQGLQLTLGYNTMVDVKI